jgi:hypothetical protein
VFALEGPGLNQEDLDSDTYLAMLLEKIIQLVNAEQEDDDAMQFRRASLQARQNKPLTALTPITFVTVTETVTTTESQEVTRTATTTAYKTAEAPVPTSTFWVTETHSEGCILTTTTMVLAPNPTPMLTPVMKVEVLQTTTEIHTATETVTTKAGGDTKQFLFHNDVPLNYDQLQTPDGTHVLTFDGEGPDAALQHISKENSLVFVPAPPTMNADEMTSWVQGVINHVAGDGARSMSLPSLRTLSFGLLVGALMLAV